MDIAKTCGLDAKTRDFYCQTMTALREAGFPFLVGGAYALERYTGIERHTKDFDIFVSPPDAPRVLAWFAAAGLQTELTHPHWLGKIHCGDAFVDVIFRSGNAVVAVDDEWFAHAVADEVLGQPVGLCPPEEILWSKAFVMERERFDGADMAHLLRAYAERLDWPRLLRRFGEHWKVLLGHLVLFGFVYPSERTRIPAWVMDDLLGCLHDELSRPPAAERVCQGTLLSRSQYLVDLERWGYLDARLEPRGTMSRHEIDLWTQAIAVDGSH